MAAAFALGAEGVWMGTRFIASKECPWHDNYKQAIVGAEETIAIDSQLGGYLAQMRAVKNEFSEAVARGEKGDTRNPYAGDAMALFYQGRTDLALVGVGESAVLIDEVKPAGDIVRDTVREFWEEIERLAKLRGG
jgi:enoyl-[acyl-carrier protein] reductase II